MTELAQAMIRAKGGPLHPAWIQFYLNPAQADGDPIQTGWPRCRELHSEC